MKMVVKLMAKIYLEKHYCKYLIKGNSLVFFLIGKTIFGIIYPIR